jgi:hypothetical protein
MTAGSLLRSLRWRRVGLVALGLLPLVAQAQFGGRRRFMDDLNSQDYQWPVDPAFAQDAFTFARLKHQRGGGFGFGYRMGWMEDYPRADVILSFRVHQITSLNVRPGPNPIDCTKEDLAQYPFVYCSGVERLAFTAEELPVLRNYLLSGGFMLVENFWGDAAWSNFADQLKRLFPDRAPVELALDHPIFHSVYDFKAKPQVPTAGQYENFGIFYDQGRDYDVMGHDPHYFAVYDDKGRMMMLICHNNHFADGWEHEGDDPNYFHVISEGMAYPMFINILTYAMTH